MSDARAVGSTARVGADDILGWSIADHLAARQLGLTVEATITAVLSALHELDDPAVLIGGPLDTVALTAARDLDRRVGERLALHGVPFAVKDNIDVAGVPTTCACPSFAYVPTDDAAVVARLRAAGAIPVAKTNLDQFATGLVGTRSPHGTPRNPVDATLIPGGSSSGSAVVVARGLVPFSLGTDTAGSGRVPAAMCGVVGLKPTVGRFSSLGMVSAVRRIDCPSVFARTVGEARLVAEVMASWEASDPYSRRAGESGRCVRRIGIPRAGLPPMEPAAAAVFEAAVSVAGDLGFELVDIDISVLLEAGRLLYGGASVAERTTAVGEFLARPGAEVDADPTVRSIILGGAQLSAVDAYRSEYALAELKARTGAIWDVVDALLLPTTPGVATLDEVAADPLGANARIGALTTFANLLDMAAIAFPLGERTDLRPSGVQLLAPAWSDDALADLAEVLSGGPKSQRPVQTGERAVVVVGAHLSGMALNHQLTTRGARLIRAGSTAPKYRLFALAATVPPKPGLRRVAEGGAAIAVETWAMSPSAFASFVDEIPPPLGLGSIELDDGSWVRGFICEPIGFDGATDITVHGGWRAYLASGSGVASASAPAGTRT